VIATSDPYAVTPRTVVVPTPTQAIEQRLEYDDFFLDVDLGDAVAADLGHRVASVRFPPGWPGDALDGFEAWASARRAGAAEGWAATVIDRTTLEAVGQMGCLALPDADGAVELRYATNVDQRDRGVATEAGGAFVEWLLDQSDVRSVVAECRVDNAPSVRVIEKLGFALVDEHEDEHGRVLRWEKRRT
jgi:[ribosomal protein S5]-alanine N-acetyltransferase